MTDNISQKDKKDWENFISKNESLPNKDLSQNKKIAFKIKSIDLHGYTLDEANKSIENFIFESYEIFDELAQKEFLKGAKIAYETIITDFSDNDNKLTTSKTLLSKKIFDQFNTALLERSKKQHSAEITFIGVESATIKEHKRIEKALEVTVDFVAEIITCIRDKDKRIISGDPEKVKKIYDTWVFSRNINSKNPNWQLVDTLT